MTKIIKILIGGIFALIILVGLISFVLQKSQNSKTVDKFIVANPLDLTQVEAISKFRSCVGHDYNGLNTAGDLEINRSMKHYIRAVKSLYNSNGKVKAMAPFDGTISEILEEQNPRGAQVWIKSPQSGGWNFIFFHIDLLPGIKQGSKVTAGEIIGYAHLEGGDNFDMGLKKFVVSPKQMLDSVLPYMDDSVLAEYEAKGITQGNLSYSQDYRDKNPCVLESGPNPNKNFQQILRGQKENGWITLTNQNSL